MQPRGAGGGGAEDATVEQLKATVGNLILPPGIGVRLMGFGGDTVEGKGGYSRINPPTPCLVGHREEAVIP